MTSSKILSSTLLARPPQNNVFFGYQSPLFPSKFNLTNPFTQTPGLGRFSTYGKWYGTTTASTTLSSPDFLSEMSSWWAWLKESHQQNQGQWATTPLHLWLCRWDTGRSYTSMQLHLTPCLSKKHSPMLKYIKKALKQGYICPLTLPGPEAYFFMKKKGGGLWPCLNYRRLNQVMIKDHYSLPLASSAMEQVWEAKNFCKLDQNLHT